MADYFYDGMPNVNERLNLLYTAFAAGPYNALLLTGGTLTGVTAGPAFESPAFRTGSQADQTTSSLRAPLIAVAGTPNEVISAGVAGIASRSFGGKFFWETEAGAYIASGNYLYKESYALRLRAFDTGGGIATAPLMILQGNGIFEIPGTLIAGRIGGSLIPSVDNAYTVGSAASAPSTIYARTGTINTSDARLKHPLRGLTAAEIAAARDIARTIGLYRWRDAVDSKGMDAREHVGPTVQRAIEIMQVHGLDPFNYGFICHDTWEAQTLDHPAIEARPAIPAADAAPAVLNSFGDVVTPAVLASEGYPAVEARAAYTEVVLEAGDRYAFRYDELAMFIAAGQEARLAALEAA